MFQDTTPKEAQTSLGCQQNMACHT